MAIGDRVSYVVDSISAAVGDFLKQNAWQYCVLETVDSQMVHALIASNGDMVSLIKVHGRLSRASVEEQASAFARLTENLTPYLNTGAHAIQMCCWRNPDGALARCQAAFAPAKETLRLQGLDIDGVFDDWADRMAMFTADEGTLLAVWTTRDALVSSQQKIANKDRVNNLKGGPVGEGVQRPNASMAQLRAPHAKVVQGTLTGLAAAGIKVELLEAREAAVAIKKMVDPDRTTEGSTVIVPGDPFPLREPAPTHPDLKGKPGTRPQGDADWWLYPSLRRQIFNRPGHEYTDQVVEFGGNLHWPVMVELPPAAEIKPWFSQLFSTLAGYDMPWRVNFLIEGDGMRGSNMRRILARTLWWMTRVNKQITQAFDAIDKDITAGRTYVRLRIVADTWVPKHTPDALKVLTKQSNNLAGAIQSWGTTQVTDVIGDPTLGVCASIPGVMRSAPSVPACAPLDETVPMLPLTRPGSVWDAGTMLFRTRDGKIFPYQPGSSKQASWLDLYIAPPRRGKSVLMNAINIAFCASPGQVELPFLSCIDIGYSSSGVIELYKAALPEHKKYLAEYKRLRNTEKYAVNPFDLELGYEFPLPSHRDFLQNFMLSLASATDPQGRQVIYDGVEGIVMQCIDRAYDEYSSKRHPKLYQRGLRNTEDVDRAVDELNIEFELGRTSWWGIVKSLVELGGPDYYHIASLAQRYAVPLLGDVAAMARDPSIEQAYTMLTPGKERATVYVARVCGMEATSKYKLLSAETSFEVSQSRIISLDLEEVMIRGAGAAATKQNSVMFMLAMYLLSARFFQTEEDAQQAPEWIRAYHVERVANLQPMPKRLCIDEFFRFTGEPGVVRQTESLVREGPKRGIQYAIASQAPSDFSPTLVQFATSVWILGTGSGGVKELVDNFTYGQDVIEAVQRLPQKPDRGGSSLVAVLSTVEGDVVQELRNTIGPQMVWALSTTSEDVSVRNALYARVGVSDALTTTGRLFPDGSAKGYLETQAQKQPGVNLIPRLIEGLVTEAQKAPARRIA